MIDTDEIRSKIDRLNTTAASDTYWRKRILEVLDEIDNTRYEVGVMSATTGRQDSETLTEAVTRVCHQLAAFQAACHHVADLYGEDSERGLAAAEILRYQRNFRAETEDTDTKIRRKVLGIALGAADDLRKRGRPVPDHTQATIEDPEAILDE
jgi:hypothetical protein